MRILKVDSIATRYCRGNGQLIGHVELQIYKPYGRLGNGWYAGSFKIPTRGVFWMRSMFHTVKAT